MAQRPSDEEARRRGPERHTRTAEPPVDAPATSPASAWPVAAQPAAAPGPTRPSESDRPASIRVKKKRRPSRGTRLRTLAKRVGYGALVVALLAGLALVVVLIVAPHHLF